MFRHRPCLYRPIAAGLKGIEDELPLPQEYTNGGLDVREKDARNAGLVRLPRDLGEAIEAFEESDFMRQTLGDHICDFLIENKRREWSDYCTTVTDWEKRHYYAGF